MTPREQIEQLLPAGYFRKKDIREKVLDSIEQLFPQWVPMPVVCEDPKRLVVLAAFESDYLENFYGPREWSFTSKYLNMEAFTHYCILPQPPQQP